MTKSTMAAMAAAAALIAGGALAQQSGADAPTAQEEEFPQKQPGQPGTQSGAQDLPGTQPGEQTASGIALRDQVRTAMQGAGFTDIRFIDAAYLVEASAPDGRRVVVFVDAPTGAPQAGQPPAGQ